MKLYISFVHFGSVMIARLDRFQIAQHLIRNASKQCENNTHMNRNNQKYHK